MFALTNGMWGSNETTDQQTTGAEKVTGVSAHVLNAVVTQQQAEDANPAADPHNEDGKSRGVGRRIAQSQDSLGNGNTKKQRTKK